MLRKSQRVVYLQQEMLVLAVHQVEEVTAKVPLSTIMLLDHVKRKDIPDSLKPRLVLPTAGQVCMSVWDSPSVETLQMWLDGVLGSYCKTEAIEVQEDFAYGLSVELARVRTTEKISANTRQTAGVVADRTREAAKAVATKTSAAWENVDSKFHITERTSTAVKAVKTGGQSAIQKTSSFFQRMGTSNNNSVEKNENGVQPTSGSGEDGGDGGDKEMSVAPPPAPVPTNAQSQPDASNYSLGEEEELVGSNK
eukprot:TRINITY_DN3122_c0_g1_i1.p2 TRINITY_DN3122_c0_g1~~TRINITY_DN3122_c0_g1_i1.p2  ORF type:complete len:252 (+),score=57.76 TRINITY_DN3122_c0_g1_i1:481-1236(+)